MPVPTKPEALLYVHKARQQELDLMADSTALAAAVERDLALCNAEQRAIFEEITAARELPPTAVKCYFIYASGGCGKTFLLNLILRQFRASGHISIATAFTGIAATVEYLLPTFACGSGGTHALCWQVTVEVKGMSPVMSCQKANVSCVVKTPGCLQLGPHLEPRDKLSKLHFLDHPAFHSSGTTI